MVTSANGPEAGFWVIAETTDLATTIRALEQVREIVDVDRRRRHYANFLKTSRDEGPFVIPFFMNHQRQVGIRPSLPVEPGVRGLRVADGRGVEDGVSNWIAPRHQPIYALMP